VPAGAERLARVDDHLGQRAAGGLVPRRADQQPVVDEHGLVERAPALGPVVADLGRAHVDQCAAGRGAQVGQLGQLAGRAVDGVLDEPLVGELDLLDPRRGEREQLGERHLGVVAAHAEGEPDHGSRD
jgi:hypothetical protein